jgi:Cu/Ag efflux pump CusA
MEHDQNVLRVTDAVEKKLDQVRATLPSGIEVITTYNRSSLIWETLTNFFVALLFGKVGRADTATDPAPVAGQGRWIPMSEVADVSVRKMPEMIRNDNGDLAGYIYIDLDNTTAPDYVEKAQDFLAKNLTLPAGYFIEWTGLYRYASDARTRLQFVVPLTLAIMFGLLVLTFGSVADSSLIMLSAPFALVGGIFLQWTLGYTMTTAVIIGYVSLFAVAIQTGIIVIEFIRDALAKRTEDQTYMDAVVEGSVARLRPKLMTVATTVLGLLPIMLFLIPCLFAIGEDIRRARLARHS